MESEKGRMVDLTPLAVEVIAESFGKWPRSKLENEKGQPVEDVKISVTRDPQMSGASSSAAFFAGLGCVGCVVLDVGLATTPACLMKQWLRRLLYIWDVLDRPAFDSFGSLHLNKDGVFPNDIPNPENINCHGLNHSCSPS
ncbi:hypothetical protein Ancab_018423 [Ancistrocladus abbreviatus]